MGGVNKLKNNFDLDEVKRCVYGKDAAMPHLDTAPTKAVDEVVKVDYKIHGCPINNKEFAYIVRCLALGKEPVIPNYPVCVECKMRETSAATSTTRSASASSPAPAATRRAPRPGSGASAAAATWTIPNVQAAREVMDQYGKTMDDLKGRLVLFNSKQERTDG